MSDIQAALGTAGAAHLYTAPDGKAYPVGYLTQAAKARFERWLKGEASAALAQYREADPAGWKQLAADYARDCAAGEFCFHGALAARAMATPAGSLALAAILFDLPLEETVRLALADADGVTAALAVVLAESSSEADRPN
jgi:hypothetical protein